MPYSIRKQKCKQADGDTGTHVVYKTKTGERVGCTSDPEQYKKALYAAEGGALSEIIKEEIEAVIYEEKDRCYRIAKRKYETFPSAYASGAIVKCRQGKIWKDLKEEELDEEKKKAGTESSKESSLRDWFGRKGAPGKTGGWVDCNTCRKDPDTGRTKCKPCGREEGEDRAKYPACRPTPSACKEMGRGDTWGKKAAKKNEILQRLREACGCKHSQPYTEPAKLSDNPYRPFSDKYYDYVKNQRSLWREGKIKFEPLDEEILRSSLGEMALYCGEQVPLDMPMPLMQQELEEAEKDGREVELNSPTRSSGPKKYKVYVKDPSTGNVNVVHFGDVKGGLSVKIHDDAARKSFVARHKCEQANDKTKASYWSCRIPRYAEQLGLSKMSYRFW